MKETFVQQINRYCSIVDIGEIRLAGTQTHFSPESRGNLTDFGTNTVRNSAQKYIRNGTARIIRGFTGAEGEGYIGARINNRGDGVYDFIVGPEVASFKGIPEYLPEYTALVTCPAGRYAKILINEKKLPGREGYGEQMNADEYFVIEFRRETPYVYDKDRVPFNTFDENGEFIAKYEPVKIPSCEAERWDSMVFRTVTLPDILCACSTQGPGDDDFVIFKYFKVQDKVFPLDCAKIYNDDYYGFPCNAVGEPLVSAFGSRVSCFDGLPDCVTPLTIKGGLYLHISQLEFNGDNPTMCYDVAFNRIGELFLSSHPRYARDHSKHAVARFRQANCASVFVPLLLQ